MAWTDKGPHSKVYRGRYKDASGRNQTAGTSTSKREALRMAQEQELKIRGGTWVDPAKGKTTLDEYFHHEWLPQRQLQVNSRQANLVNYRTSIGPRFGQLQLRKITPPAVQKWVNEMVEQNLAPGTVRAKFALLQSILDGQRGASAVRDGYLERSPCGHVDLPRLLSRQIRALEPQEVRAVMAAAEPWWAPLIEAAVETGMRWGELIALRPCDVVAGVISVDHTIIEVTKTVSGNGTRFMAKDTPKSGRSRQISASQRLLELFAALAEARGLADTDLFFAMPDPSSSDEAGTVTRSLRSAVWPGGVPVSRSHGRDWWQKAVEAAGVAPCRFHDLRASHLTWLLSQGCDLTTVMDRAGHSQVRTTQRYLGVRSNAGDRALAALSEAWTGAVITPS